MGDFRFHFRKRRPAFSLTGREAFGDPIFLRFELTIPDDGFDDFPRFAGDLLAFPAPLRGGGCRMEERLSVVHVFLRFLGRTACDAFYSFSFFRSWWGEGFPPPLDFSTCRDCRENPVSIREENGFDGIGDETIPCFQFYLRELAERTKAVQLLALIVKMREEGFDCRFCLLRFIDRGGVRGEESARIDPANFPKVISGMDANEESAGIMGAEERHMQGFVFFNRNFEEPRDAFDFFGFEAVGIEAHCHSPVGVELATTAMDIF